MPALSCYKLKREIEGNKQPDFDDYVSGAAGLSTVGPVTYPDFEAKLITLLVIPGNRHGANSWRMAYEQRLTGRAGNPRAPY